MGVIYMALSWAWIISDEVFAVQADLDREQRPWHDLGQPRRPRSRHWRRLHGDPVQGVRGGRPAVWQRAGPSMVDAADDSGDAAALAGADAGRLEPDRDVGLHRGALCLALCGR